MKYLRRVLLITFIVVSCLVAFWFIFKKHYLKDLIHARFEKDLNKHIENHFQFTFDNLTINLFSNKLKVTGFNLLLLSQADTVGFFKGDILIHIQGWRNMLFDKQKEITKIALKKVDLYYAQNYPLIIRNDKSSENQQFTISNLSAIGKLNFSEHHENKVGKLTSKFNIDLALNYNNETKFNFNNLINRVSRLKVSAFHYYLPDGFHQVQIAEVIYSELNSIRLKELIIKPVDSKKTFSIKKKVATDYISILIDSIQLTANDKNFNEGIYIDQVKVFQPNFDIFKDKNFPENQEYTAILVDLLRDIKIPIHIRTTEVNNMLITYTELANKAKEAGELFFSDAKAKITNITNVKDSLQHSGNMLIEAEAKFYGIGLLKTSMKYKILSKSGQFDIRGSLGPMNMVKVNSIISKLVPIKVNSGQLKDLHFNFSGTRLQSEGEMWFEYSDLNIELLQVEFFDSEFTQKAISRLGNMVMRNANPSGNGVFKIGEIKKDRNANKSMFNYWWVSLQSGFLSTLGVTAEKQKINYNSGEPATFVDKLGLGDK